MKPADFLGQPSRLAAASTDALSDELVRNAKAALRRRMRSLLEATPAGARARRSAAVVERLLTLPALQTARAVASFWPMEHEGEVDLRALDAALRARGVRLYYPFMDRTEAGFRTGFRRVDDPGVLAPRGRGFPEPPRDAPEAARGELDMVLVSALSAAPDGHRVGRGAGWYDATLPDVCPPARAIVVVYDFQLLGELPVGPRDHRCDAVVTDRRTFGA